MPMKRKCLIMHNASQTHDKAMKLDRGLRYLGVIFLRKCTIMCSLIGQNMHSVYRELEIQF